jgi:diguanylate cyclase (GGDEF)-like protein
MKIKKKYVVVSLILLIILLMFSSHNLFTKHITVLNGERSVLLDKGWEFRWDGNEKSPILSLPFIAKNGKANEVLWVSNTLPMKTYNGATLFLRTSQQYLKVYLEGKLIYSYTCYSKKQDINLPGSAFHFIGLPSGYEGKLIEISLVSPFKTYTGHVNNIYIGSKSAHIMNVLYKYGGSLIIAGLIILLGLILLILSVVVKSYKSRYEGFLFLGVFSLLSGIWIASESKIIQFFINSPILLFYVACLSLFLIPIPLIYFIIVTFNPQESKLLLVFIKFFTGYFFIVSTLQIFYRSTFLLALIIFNILLQLGILLLIYLSIKEILSGNKSIKLFFLGCIIISVFAMLDIGRFYFSKTPGLNAQGFLQFGFLLFILVMAASMGHFIKEIFEIQTKSEVYASLAYTDILTNLKNRNSFEERIAELNQTIEEENIVSIILFDLNNLKFVNDSMGHKEGDKIIYEASRIISQSFEGIGETYRIGGDEFIVICKEYSERALNENFLSFEQKINEHNKDSAHVSLGIAYGIASFTKGEDRDLHSVLIRADEAMYMKKQTQKNKF